MPCTEIISNDYFGLKLKWRGSMLEKTEILPAQGLAFQGETSVPRHPGLARAITEYSVENWPVIRELPLPFQCMSPFQARVLSILKKQVPFGYTITYKGLAELSGSPGAARAVGQTMARNLWPVIVPCHRVVGQNSPGGFSSGLKIKEKLLLLEKEHSKGCGKLNTNTPSRKNIDHSGRTSMK